MGSKSYRTEYLWTLLLTAVALAACVSSPATDEAQPVALTSTVVAPVDVGAANPSATPMPPESPTPSEATAFAPTPTLLPEPTVAPLGGNLILYAAAVDLPVASAPNGRMGRYFAFRTLPALPFLDSTFFDAFYGKTENMSPIGMFFDSFRPQPSPDRRYMLLPGLTAYPDAGIEGTGTWLIDLEGGAARQLLAGGAAATWSPAADAITYVEGNTLYTLSIADGAEPRPIFQHPDLWSQYAKWSPAGQWIAALTTQESYEYETGYAATYWLVPPGGGEARELATQPAGAIEYSASDVSWSPDGQYLLARNRVFDLEGNLLSPDYPGVVDWLPGEPNLLSNGNDGLRLISIAGEEIARISEGYFANDWAFSRDGQQLAYTLPRGEEGAGAAVYDLDSKESRIVGTVPGAVELSLLRWSADDSRLIAGVYMGERYEIWTLAAEPGGAVELLLEHAELIEVVPYSPN